MKNLFFSHLAMKLHFMNAFVGGVKTAKKENLKTTCPKNMNRERLFPQRHLTFVGK
jgi:hypothetical protein